MARRIPGKEEFDDTLRYYRRRMELLGVEQRLGKRVGLEELKGFDAVVVATGVKPRIPGIPGIDHPKVKSYFEVLLGGAEVGRRVAIIGAGGIGFDVAELLTHGHQGVADLDSFLDEWGVDRAHRSPGALKQPVRPAPSRSVTMLQRSKDKPGGRLGKTTGWIHRAQLKQRGVRVENGVSYEKIDEAGLHISLAGKAVLIEADTIVICAGQLEENALLAPLQAAGIEAHAIGGAKLAGELDAKRAIEEGALVAMGL